jgi:hypothetical protein
LAKAKEREKLLNLEILNIQMRPFECVPSSGAQTGIPSDFTFNLTQMAAGIADTSATGETLHNTALNEDDRAENERTKNILRERTAQLKILMETLDTLQHAGIKPSQGTGKGRGDEYLGEGSDGLFNLAGLAATPLSPPRDEPGSWGVQSLVRRVVELTADLTSQVYSMHWIYVYIYI